MMPEEWIVEGAMPFSLSITDAPSTGLFVWELRDQGFIAGGQAPTIDRCITEIARARLTIEHHVQRRNAHTPGAALDSHPSLYLAPILQFDPPHCHPGALEQHIPPPERVHASRPLSLYLPLSESGWLPGLNFFR